MTRPPAYDRVISGLSAGSQGHHFDALGFRFTVTVSEPRLAAYIDTLLDALVRPGPADHHYELCAAGIDGTYELRFDGEFVLGGQPAERYVGPLIQHVNRRAVEGSELVTIHAGGVEFDGVGVVLPASTTSGKTTLVAGLVRAGFGYLTDEAVALDTDSRTIRPYPRPLTLDKGAWPLFPELEPRADLPTDGHKASQWHVPPDAIRPGAVGRSCPIAILVFPRFEAGAKPQLEPLSRGQALIEVARNTFRFRERGAAALDLLAEAVRPAACYRLTTGVLDPAVALVAGLPGAGGSLP